MNETIKSQLNHRSIRKFKDKKIADEIIKNLVEVAQSTSTSNFMQSYSILSITDQKLKDQISQVSKQEYVAQAPHLFIFLVDQNRNQAIARENKKDTQVLHSFDRFLIGASDALLAAQNTLTAAESLGLGGVLLGSILNNAQEIVKILDLPLMTFPILGLGLGYPDQNPQLKPRLPQHMMHFENSYPEWKNINQELSAYDEEVHNYYDLRNENQREDYFTKQITDGMERKPEGRMQLLDFLQAQGFAKF